jgi:hypothetical protein
LIERFTRQIRAENAASRALRERGFNPQAERQRFFSRRRIVENKGGRRKVP